LFGTKVVEGLDEVEEGTNFDCAVDLGKLGQETGDERAGEEGAVACIGGVAGAEGGEDGRGRSAESEGVKGGFQEVVERLDRCWREAEDVPRELDTINTRICPRENDTHGILEEIGTGGCLGEAKEGSKSCALGPPVVFVTVQADRDGESADEHLTCETAHFVVGSATYAGHDGMIATPRCGMVERVSACEEDLCEFFIVICHHGGARGFLCHGKEVVDVFDGAKGLLPELELDRGIELRKAGIEVVLEDLWVGEVDGMSLVSIFCDVGEVETEGLAQTAELDLALVLETEAEGLLCDLLAEGIRRCGRCASRTVLTWYMASSRALFLRVSRDVR